MKFRAQHYVLGLIGAAVLTACGGGGDAIGTAPIAAGSGTGITSITSTVMDGLIRNALVCLDTNNNNACDAGETQGRTNGAGKVTLDVATADLASARLIAMIGTDAEDLDTGPVGTAYVLTTPAGRHEVISPLTTMVQAKIDTDQVDVETAAAYVRSQAGLSAISVFDDFIARRDQNPEHKKAATVARLLVVSIQQAKQSSTPNCAVPPNDTDQLREARIHANLLGSLLDIGSNSDEIERKICSKGNLAKDCDSDITSRAATVSSCLKPITPHTAGTTPETEDDSVPTPAAPTATSHPARQGDMR